MSNTKQSALQERPTLVEPTVELHATNLHGISHMEWTNDGRLLASELSAGQVKDVTEGGNMKDQAPFAEGLEGPASMVPMEDGRILTSECWGGRVTDISSGGDVSSVDPFAWGLDGPYGLMHHLHKGEGRILVSASDNAHSYILDITDGGDATHADPVVTDSPPATGSPGISPLDENWSETWEKHAAGYCDNADDWPTTGVGVKAFTSVGSMGMILDISTVSGETTSDLIRNGHVVARGLDRIGGIKYNPKDGLIYGVNPDEGSVFVVDPEDPKNYRFTPPLVTGLVGPTCLRFGPGGDTMYVCGQGEGVVWKVIDFKPT